jgi:hypothetical protein
LREGRSKEEEMLFSCLLGILWATVSLESAASAGDSGISALVRSVDVLGLIGKPVAGEKWEHVARIERVLLNPESGRATFVVLAFVGGEGTLAVPWEEMSIDELGRARLKRPGRFLDSALRFHPRSVEILEREPTGGSMPPGPPGGLSRVRMAGGEEGVTEGPVVGRMSLRDENGDRRVVAILELSERMVPVDLGSEEYLVRQGIEVRTGDWIQVRSRARSSDRAGTLEASALRKGSRWVELLPR